MKTKIGSLEATEAELEYRNKRCHELRAIKQRELSCSSCGNVLSHEPSELFAHPVLGILQCRKCNERAKQTLSSESPTCCLICAGASRTLYKCEKKSCAQRFCQACVKRNVPQSLAEAESKKWKCLYCSPKPLWKLRGACAAVMKTVSRRTKRKKVSGNRSSETEDDKSDLKSISYVRRRRLDQTKELRKRLNTVCDQDSPAEGARTQAPYDRNRQETKRDKTETSKKLESYFGYGNDALRVSEMSTDDSDVEVIKPARYKRAARATRSSEASPSKALKDRERKRGRRKNSMSSRRSSASSLDSTESDTSETEKNRGAFAKRGRESDKKITSVRKKVSREDAEIEERRTRKRRKYETPRDNVAKTASGGDKKSSRKLSEEANDNIEDGRTLRSLASKRQEPVKKSGYADRARKSKREISSEKNENSGDSSRNENKRERPKKKNPDHLRVEGQKLFTSDSSSGKEFSKSKLFRTTRVTLERLSEKVEDRTNTTDESPEEPRDVTSDQSFPLKNTVSNFYTELKKAAAKLMNDIEQAERNYCVKDSMRTPDVNRLILETKNVVTRFKRCVDRGETKLDDSYDKWCHKTKVRNVLKTRRASDVKETEASSSSRRSERSSTRKNDAENEMSPSASPERKDDEEISGANAIVGNENNLTVLSDCNSEEIFSGDETRNSVRKDKPLGGREKSPELREAEKRDEASDIDGEVATPCDSSKDRNCDEPCESGAKKTISSSVLETRRESVDPSDVDIFETTMDSPRERSAEKDNAEESAKVSVERSLIESEESGNKDKVKSPTRHSDCPDSRILEDSNALSEPEETTGLPGDLEASSKRLEASPDSEDKADTRGDSKVAPIESLVEEGLSPEDLPGEEDPGENPKSISHPEKSAIESGDEETPGKVTGPRASEDNDESLHSVDTLVEGLRNAEDLGERPASAMSLGEDSERAASNAVTDDEIASRSSNVAETQDTLEVERDVADSRSVDGDPSPRLPEDDPGSSPIQNRERAESPVIEASGQRSSTDTMIAEYFAADSSSGRSLSNRLSRSSTPSESEDICARNHLLQSSNSDESSVEDSSILPNSGTLDNEDAPPTPPESDSNSPTGTGNDRNEHSERNVKTKRKKFCIDNCPRLMADERLRQRCVVRVVRLKKRVLNRYASALKKSRDYVDSKKLKSLVSLNKLEKKKKSGKNSDSEESASGSSRNKKKSRATKEREETLLDHLEKVKNGKSVEPSGEQSDSDNNGKAGGSKKNKSDDRMEESLFSEADRMAKKRLLESSDSGGEETSMPETQDKEGEAEDEETSKSKKVVKKEKRGKAPEEEEKNQEKGEKSGWRKNKILTLKISDSDSEEEEKTFESSQKKLAEKNKNKGSDSDSEVDETPKKKRVRRRVLHSDSDVQVSAPSESEKSVESDADNKKKKKKGDSDNEAKKKTRKRIRRGERNSSSSDSLDEARPKSRRKRIKTATSDSDSDVENSQGTPGKSGRKNIRKVIRDKQVADDTKQAAKDEEERLARIAERQKLYNQMYENRLAGETKVDKLVLDFDEKTQEPLVSVDEDLVKRLKPHQAQGIKFMWDACFESLERTKTTKGSGCILAHCMGLGKSFQVVALSHTLLTHEETGVKTIMVVCPLSTVLNWVNEFKMWLENIEDGDDIEVYELTRTKQNFERKCQLQRWQKTGGVLIIGYEMFRNLSNASKKVRKNIQEAFLKCLVDPGPDLIVCDEGHLLKNEDTALSKAMRRVRTLRRIVLTGTPLQNNLIEYHCMVQFVKPNLLGTKKEFTNRFENPITNGQFDDSTEYDVRLMKKRAHVLHKMLEGSVQRLDYSVLTPFLPPKQEYVIFVKLTEIQIRMYRHYLENYARRHRGVGGSLFADFQALQRIWTHPLVMQMNLKKIELANEKKRLDATDSEGSLRDFIDDNSDSDTSASSDQRSGSGTDEDTTKKTMRSTRANPVTEELPNVANIEKSEEPTSTNDEHEWWTQFVKEDDYEDMKISSKLLILFSILKESHTIGDKVLVFSQSLYSLTLIEEFLRLIDDATHGGNDAPDNLDGHSGSWSLGLDYFRLDGQTTTDNRRRWCDIFNRPTNTRARLFLISTRAGGLGINLTAANRVIIFDASWNPSHDVQSIFRIYRFGQKKPCYVYRLLAAGTMEEKIYNRQVTKLSLSCRVVDEQQIERHYSNNALTELYKLEISETEQTLKLPKDRLLAEIFLKYKHCVENYHEHDSLLENQAGEELDEEERQQAWLEYEEEKKGKRVMPQAPFMTYQNEILMQQMNLINMAQQAPAITNPAMMLDYENLKQMMLKDFPGIPEAQRKAMAERAVYDMYEYVERQAMANQNPMVAMTGAHGYDNRMGQQQPHMPSHPTSDMIRMYQQSLIQQQNGQMNFPINQAQMIDPTGLMRTPTVVQKPLMAAQPLAASSSNHDDDIVEIPSSPEKNPVAPAPAPGGSRKSQEE